MKNEKDEQNQKNVGKQPLDHQQSARRRLLAAAVYTPPVILGTMMAGPRHALGAWGQVKTCKMAGGGAPVMITISSGASACCPCVPGSKKYNPVKCSKSQCVKSCGVTVAACQAAGGVAAIKCKDFCKEGPPGCVPPAGCRKPCNCLPPGQRKKNKNKKGKNGLKAC